MENFYLVFFVTWLATRGLRNIETERGGGRRCDMCVVRWSGAGVVVWMRKNIADQRRRKKLHSKRIFFMLKDCTRRARFKICALATACTGLVEIQTLRSVYETQIKKTV